MVAGCVGSGQKRRVQARNISWLGTEWNPSHHKSFSANQTEPEGSKTCGRSVAPQAGGGLFPNSRAASSGASLLTGAGLSP